MKLLIDNITINPDEPSEHIRQAIAERLNIDIDFEYTIARKSLDARKKQMIVYRYRVVIDVPDDKAKLLLNKSDVSVFTEKSLPAVIKREIAEPIMIAGAGPAGLFCALRLIAAGARVELFERGKPMGERMKDIEMLEREGVLDERSNVLFGEGGAGAYSDGKLTTRIRRQEIDWLFKAMVEAGAPSSILYEAKPHLGTDRLRGIVKNIRDAILSSESAVHFNESIDDIIIHDGLLAGFVTSRGNEYKSGRLVLAIGHSARDTYAMLVSKNIALEKKGFAAGVRIEHPAELINEIQYGASKHRDILPAADYALTYTAGGRGVYSFCMCPGGRVINSSSESNRLCTNGMSFSKRDLPFSNSALVVAVAPGECATETLGGITFQRDMESAAFVAGSGSFVAPAQRVTSFLAGKVDCDLPAVSYRPGVLPVDINRYLPDWMAEELTSALGYFNRKMKGFISDEGVLIGVETRTSSPVRILRGDDFQSVSVKGLYPVGEGAGYAGGIVSSAVDGIRCADRILQEIT
ncbi:MAG: NAD(P)/FAD-dependent oxidoreductase [Spirochaetes bacterium]|nr:NAD(P)/FAD-dependent oxidoreductase [Spirochaetota bacterium]